MNDTNLQMFDIVSNVPQNRNTHDEKIKFYILYLPLQLFYWSSLQEILDLFILFLLLTHLIFLRLLLSLLFSVFHTLSDLFGNLFVAVVDDLDKKISTLIDSCSVKHKNFKYVTYNTFVVNCEVDLH